MDKQIRRIGVLTSGGDAPGMNALIRSVVRSASANDISVLGIRRGYSGLINGDIIEMGARSVDGIIRKGGTMLYTARCKEMLTEEGLHQIRRSVYQDSCLCTSKAYFLSHKNTGNFNTLEIKGVFTGYFSIEA